MVDVLENNKEFIEVYYNESHTGIEIKNHFHNSDEVIYILQGTAEFTVHNKVYSASTGDIIFISGLETHEMKVLQYPYKRYFILTKPSHLHSLVNQPILASIFKHRPSHFQHVLHLSPEENVQVLDIIKKMHTEYMRKDAFWEFSLSTYINLLFVFLYRSHKEAFPLSTVDRPTHMILEIQRFVEQHFTEELSLDEVSKLFFSDMFYISRLFKKITGFNFKDYIIRLRISQAKDLLHHTLDDITTVSLNSGFNNVNHFIRIFKKYEGITPYQYRKMRRE